MNYEKLHNRIVTYVQKNPDESISDELLQSLQEIYPDASDRFNFIDEETGKLVRIINLDKGEDIEIAL